MVSASITSKTRPASESLSRKAARVLGLGSFDGNIAVGDGSGQQVGPGLNAVGQDAVVGAVKGVHTLDVQRVAADSR